MPRSKPRVIPIACVDCGRDLVASRRRNLGRDRTPMTHFRCVRCEDQFLTVLDPRRLEIAIRGLSRE